MELPVRQDMELTVRHDSIGHEAALAAVAAAVRAGLAMGVALILLWPW